MDFPQARLVRINGTGPEDVLVDRAGRVYTGLEDGRIIRVSDGGDRIDMVARVQGRPLGLEFLGTDELLVCASQGGLLAVPLDRGPVRTLSDTLAGRPLRAVSDAAVAADGTVYFAGVREVPALWFRSLTGGAPGTLPRPGARGRRLAVPYE